MKRLAILLLALPMAANAVPITLTMSGEGVNVDYGGTVGFVDLAMEIIADTDDFQAILSSGAGSGYAGVLVSYTSAALGLADVTGSELWDISIQFGGIQDSVILNDSGIFSGRGAIDFGGAISAWDGISSLGPVVASGLVSNGGGTPTDSIGGTSFTLLNWSLGTTFTAEVAAVPEPSTLALFGIGLAGLGLVRRRRTQ